MQKSVHEARVTGGNSEASAGAGTTGEMTQAETTTFPFVVALTFAHLLNDVMQSLIPAIYPIIKTTYGLSFGQIGLITLAFQLTASVLQPFVGIYTDRRPSPYSTIIGMACTMIGLLVLSHAGSFGALLLGSAIVGTGSSIFHPEAVRMARAASGGRHGFAQSLFQVGGQTGQAIGPLLAAFIVVPQGQTSLAWFSVLALVAMFVLFRVGMWFQQHSLQVASRIMESGKDSAASSGVPAISVTLPVVVLIVLMFSKSAYTSSLSNYLTFYFIEKFGIGVQASQVLLFVFLVSQAVGSLIGGYVGDRIGRHQIIWFSILGALPFTLALPYVGLNASIVLTVLIGMIMASAFPAILVYALDLLPGKVGMVAGAFYGLTFGLGAISAAMLGKVADWTSLSTVYILCSYLPLIGLMTWFLPRIETRTR